MRERMEGFMVLPFSFGCASHSSVELGGPKADSKGSTVTRREAGEGRGESSSKSAKMIIKTNKSSSGLLHTLSKPNIVGGIQHLIRGIKNLSQFLFYKEETKEMEAEMEIGYPTDVKHLTHIGLDGSTTTTTPNDKAWDNLKPPPELLSLSSISFKHFEIAMAAQAHHPLLNDPSSRFG
ncbi:CRIB domain-containing protein RIC4-like [Prosopis cineraria]|uniref:CRIB domain-containing protein RIC4-like n=1 Tax=Prosopis cineraria TaxID=364024 RepID=UPI00240EADDD|nr:CRIB domain-containing protein RIC4-like [Prosopis cineraria]